MREKLFQLKKSVNFITPFLVILFLLGCTHRDSTNKKGKVHIEYRDGKYTLFRNGQPFNIRGAAGYTYLKELHEIGGNTIRTWDTANIGSILDQAQANNLAVVVGFYMPNSEYLDFFYKDSAKVNAQFRAFKKIIQKYKNHPAVLMWSVGNELTFHYQLTYNSFYRCFNNIVDMIHQEDPDHPVTTTLINFPPKAIFIIKARTSVDVLSFNIFGALSSLRRDIKKYSWFWKGPYLISEWGIDGPELEYEHTSWKAYIENSSTKKAEQYLQRYQKEMPVEDRHFLGSLVFYWGQKQECTSTWFSLFSPEGAPTATVGVMQYIWTGKWPPHQAPKINLMLIDNKQAKDNLIFKPATIASAKVLMVEPDSTISRIEWHLYNEDWYRKNNISNEKKLAPIDSSIISSNNLGTTFRTPDREGPYRLFVTIYNKYGYFATCNTPIYVVK